MGEGRKQRRRERGGEEGGRGGRKRKGEGEGGMEREREGGRVVGHVCKNNESGKKPFTSSTIISSFKTGQTIYPFSFVRYNMHIVCTLETLTRIHIGTSHVPYSLCNPNTVTGERGCPISSFHIMSCAYCTTHAPCVTCTISTLCSLWKLSRESISVQVTHPA